ncbi:MAG: MATE family efflux transporter, partial [Muribaculaceae bacterium]|nr:MATE family efflux transporter [Muribaculaceae bacterium]
GASPFLINIAGCCINVLINNTLYKYGGDIAIGAAGIFNTYTQMVVMTVLGICQGLQPIIGYNFGANKYDRMRSAYFRAIWVSLVIFTIGTLGSMCGTKYIVKAFTTDSELIDASIYALRLSTISFWTVGIPIISTALFQSVGDAGKAIFLSLTRQVIYIIPIMLILPRILGLKGVWLSFPLSDLCTLATTIILVKRELSRIKTRMGVINVE